MRIEDLLERRVLALEVALRQLLSAAMPVRADSATLREVANAIPALNDVCQSASIVLANFAPPSPEPPLYRPDRTAPYDRRVNLFGGPNKLAEAMEADPEWAARQPDLVLFSRDWPQYFDAAFRDKWYRKD